MDISAIINTKIFIGISSGIGGIAIAIITQYLLNKRGIFSYYVFHNRVGLSTEDAIYGSVKVTWNGNPVAHLYLSTIELINESVKDYESVSVRIYSNDTLLLTQRTEVVGTTHFLDFTEEYKNKIAVKEGFKPSDIQFNLFQRQRDFFVPTLNRGQKLIFQFLNAAISEKQPNIWVDVLHKGIKCKFRIARNMAFGVPQPDAALIGTIVGFIAVVLVAIFVPNLPIAAILSFIIGVLVLIPGAFTIKILRKIRDWLAG
jgi:hypothetical protein